MALISKAKILEDLYERYYRGLVDTTTLIKALETLPGEYELSAGEMKVMEGLPPARVGVNAAARLEELIRDKDILERRVTAIREEYDALPDDEKYTSREVK